MIEQERAEIAAAIASLPPTHQRLLRVAVVPGQAGRGWQARLFRVSRQSIGVWRLRIASALGANDWNHAVYMAFIANAVEPEIIEVSTMAT